MEAKTMAEVINTLFFVKLAEGADEATLMALMNQYNYWADKAKV
jgi:hypothetical protein